MEGIKVYIIWKETLNAFGQFGLLGYILQSDEELMDKNVTQVWADDRQIIMWTLGCVW